MKTIILFALILFPLASYGQNNHLFIEIFDKWNNALRDGDAGVFSQYLMKQRAQLYAECMESKQCAKHLMSQALQRYEVIGVKKLDDSYRLDIAGVEVSGNKVEGKVFFRKKGDVWKISMSEWGMVK